MSYYRWLFHSLPCKSVQEAFFCVNEIFLMLILGMINVLIRPLGEGSHDEFHVIELFDEIEKDLLGEL